MNTNKNNTFNIEYAKQNIAKLTQKLDAHRTAIITKNNLPKYIMIRYDSIYPPID